METGSFFSRPRALHAHLVPPSQPSAPFLRRPELAKPAASLALRHRPLSASQPHGLTQGQCGGGAPGAGGVWSPDSHPSGPARSGALPHLRPPSELQPTDSRPRRAGSPLPFSPLASSSSRRCWEGGGGRGCLPAPTSRRGRARGLGRAQKAASAPLRPRAVKLQLQPPQLLPPPGLPGGATARHLDGGAPGT